MTVVRLPPAAPPKPPHADQKTSESRMPTTPTISRIQPIAVKVVAYSRTAPTATRIRLTLMPMLPPQMVVPGQNGRGAPGGSAEAGLDHLAAAVQRPPEGHFVCVLEVAADRKPARESRNARAAAQPVREIGRGRLAGHVRVGREHDLLHAVSLHPVEQLVDPQVRRLDAVQRRERAAEHVVQAAELRRPLDR